MIGSAKAGPSCDAARFAREFQRGPIESVVADRHNGLVPCFSHVPKGPVGVDKTQGAKAGIHLLPSSVQLQHVGHHQLIDDPHL